MPREHGSWALLIAPLLAGLIAAGGGAPGPLALLFAAALSAFLFRPALLDALGGPPSSFLKPALFGALAAAAFAPLLLVDRLWSLLVLAVPAAAALTLNVRWMRGRRAFSWLNEVSGVLVLCLGAPAAFDAARGRLDASAWTAWALCALFFVGPVFFVKLAALQHRAAAGAAAPAAVSRLARASLAFHAAAFAAVAA
ncbi:MAG: YwiC-like family protein, partial [Elusimicrobia bacterium]|nr:YwiC-like family protein [Elusimicrobiota bacterium]